MPVDQVRATMLRTHLADAGVERAEQFARNARQKNITFHDLRATGITWMAVAGEEPLRIKQRAGHRTFSTTEGYIREAENLRSGFGEVFPALPADLAPSAEEPTQEPTETPNQAVSSEIPSGEKGDSKPILATLLRPRETADQARINVDR
jgi:hypothetical protein